MIRSNRNSAWSGGGALGALLLLSTIVVLLPSCKQDLQLGSLGPGVGREGCGNGMDDDSDGLIDEGCPCSATETQACFGGRYPNRLVGRCRDGLQMCEPASVGDEFGTWAGCAGDTVPGVERCDGSFDDDCDGAVDEGCPCEGSGNRVCGIEFSGGVCHPGEQSCDATGLWSGCVGAIGPSAEVCADGLDNDCDGAADEGCECIAAPEVCGDGLDNDCDGEVDEPRCSGDSECPERFSHVVDIAMAQDHACALIDDGRLYCWGDNTLGTLGIGEGEGPEQTMAQLTLSGGETLTYIRDFSSRALRVPGIQGARRLALSARSTTCVLGIGGVYCLGPEPNARFDEGEGHFVGISWTAELEPESRPLGALGELAISRQVVSTLDESGDIWGWGGSDFYLLGEVEQGRWDEGDPAVKARLESATQVDSLALSTCAVLENGRISCWGHNDKDQLGVAGEAFLPIPRTLAGLEDALSVEVGFWHSCALRQGGRVSCWGADGLRGDGSVRSVHSSSSATPTEIEGLSNVVDLDASLLATCAVLEEGTVQCWGGMIAYREPLDSGVQSFLDPTTGYALPRVVEGVSDAIVVAHSGVPGSGTLCVLERCGRVRCMGRNNLGQLGDGTTDDSTTFTEVLGLP